MQCAYIYCFNKRRTVYTVCTLRDCCRSPPNLVYLSKESRGPVYIYIDKLMIRSWMKLEFEDVMFHNITEQLMGYVWGFFFYAEFI